MKPFHIFLISGTLLLAACSEKEFMPGEMEFLAEVKVAEQKIEDQISSGGSPSSTLCGELDGHFAKGVESFKEMMPSLKGLALRKRDMRLGAIREFVEDNC